MTKHTQGPWRTAGDQGVQIRSEKDQIAKVWAMRGNEWKANAALIAAAPDLLSALEELIVFAEIAETNILTGDEGCLWPVERARVAIAKAKGEAK